MIYSPQSKVWIYQSNRLFSNTDLDYLHTVLNTFVQNWSAHNHNLKAGYEIRHQRFIVLIVDETQTGASGCSIDKSVHLMKQIEEHLSIDLFDRFQIAWKEGENIRISNKSEFENLLVSETINANTIVFNNLVKSYEEYLNQWETPIIKSWHFKVFAVPVS
jgi:hypothetical protein